MHTRADMTRDDTGAVAVIVALLLVVFLVLAAFVVDMGYWYTTRRQLQTAADAAALAGCRELANGASNAEIWEVVEEYAASNEVTPVENHAVVPPSPGGQSDIADDAVKVTVTSNARSFFARVIGMETNEIAAQARAEVAYLVGARAPMPWALPILRVTRMTATVGGTEVDLSPGGGGSWEGYLPTGSTGSVRVTAYNEQNLDPSYPQGVPEVIENAARITRIPADSRIAEVRLNKSTVTAGYGEHVSVFVTLTEALEDSETVVAAYGNKNGVALGQTSPLTYAGAIAAPSTDDLYDSFGLNVEIRDTKDKIVEGLSPAAVILVRRSTYPVKNVRVTPQTVRAGESVTPHIEVELNDYEYGQPYELKVVGGAGEHGNYMAIDFHTLRHEPYWRHPQDPAEYPELPSGTSTYYEYIAGVPQYDFVVHVGDTVWTEPGNMSGPQTRSALDTRFGFEPADFSSWEAEGRPATKRVVIVPIVEKVQETTGITPLRVVSFASFYVDSVSSSSGSALVRGRFIEYVTAGWVTSPYPPDPSYAVQAVHLTSDNVDF